jgi:hypothetical protein
LVHKQYLFLYPLVLGVVEAVAFYAVYAALGGAPTWSEFARANFAPATFLREHLSDLTRPGAPLVVALAAGVCVCLISAAIRAPFYRAIAGPSYPLAPRSRTELWRLFIFYLVSYPLLRLLPAFFQQGTVWAAAGWVALLVASVAIVYTDYIIVLEDLSIGRALSRGVRVLRKGWLLTMVFYLGFILLYSPVWDFYSAHYDGNFRVLFPVSQLLADTLYALVGDVVFIFLYDHIRRS